MPRAVIFDLYNTLVPGGDAERQALVATQADDLGVDPRALWAVWAATWPQRSIGATGDLASTLRMLCDRIGAHPSPERIRLACARSEELTRRLLWPKPQTLAVLDALRRAGWLLGLVSNTAGTTGPLWPTTPLCGRFGAAAALSSVVGAAKPDPAIFLMVCRQLGVDPTECVYVGDGADNELGAAAALGMLVVRTTQYKPAEGLWPPHRIADLAELPALLATGRRG